MDELLNYPKADPHGEPIPDTHGKIPTEKRTPLSAHKEGKKVKIIAVSVDQKSFLDHLNAKGLQIGDTIMIVKRELFDGSVTILKSQKEIVLSHQVSENILVSGDEI